jgi:hypothetical protein
MRSLIDRDEGTLTMTRRTLIVFLSVILFAPAKTWASEFVVLTSTVSSVSVGQVVSAGQKIEIPEKARLILINETGKTVTIKGPYSGVPGGEGKPQTSRFIKALASLVTTTEQDTRAVGAIRAAGIRTKRQALMINISETGDYCLLKGNKEEITRYKSEKFSDVTIVATKDGKQTKFPWPKESPYTPWPGALTLEDGGTYLASQSGKDTRTMMIMHRMEGDFSTDIPLALAMGAQGCVEQAKMIFALVRRSAQ